MAKTIGIEQLQRVLLRLPDNPRVVLSGNVATPLTMLDIVDKTLERVTLNLLNAIHPMPRRDGVTLETIFVGPGMRGAPNLRYVPCRLSMLPLLLRHSMLPHAVIINTSTPRSEAVSLGIEVNVMPAAIEAARTHGGIVIAMVNPHMPHTLGDALIDLDEIDYLVEVEEQVTAPEPSPIDANAHRIGRLIGAQIRNGSTLQLGIGAVPDSVLHEVTAARGIRIWSETISDGVLALERSGALDPDVPVQPSFMIGSNELYAWADSNPRVSMVRTERCNDPALIAKHHGMTSVNGALEVDLHGQANASRVRGRIYSGFGGSLDFIGGALQAPGGRSFMALPSWHPRANASTIVPYLDGPATSFQQTAVVTEQGIAWIFGSSEREQAKHLIEKAAHPDAREGLWEAAAQMKLY
ncbi:MAG: acetyl-CoA hydrolase/transferase C-terminal domain-containing protein [Actinomycetes bacterium]